VQAGRLEEAQVRAMFDRIAGQYDRMNTVMTAGLHRSWRRRAAELAAVSPGDRVLDVATGTGDLALELASRVAPGGEVVGIDFSQRMLELARSKAAVGWPPDVTVRFQHANAQALPYPDDHYAAATVAFGARNFARLERGLAVLEITTPTRPPLSTFLEVWFDRVVPVLGRLAGDAQAYSYLPRSVRRFPGPQQLARVMWSSGLSDIRYLVTAGGIVALHVGVVRTQAS
jgi:demethylmenaquinone methyltransferase/2-methoxy-6-polyprenyl-1,4-benzoquinol methylase